MLPASRPMTARTLAIALLLALTTVFLGSVSAFAQDDEEDLSNLHIFPFHSNVPGLWKCTMIIDDGVNNQFLPEVLRMSANLMSDGNMLNQTTHPNKGVPVEDVLGPDGEVVLPAHLWKLGNGHGQWRQVTQRRLVMATRRIAWSTQGNEEFNAFARARAVLRLNGRGTKMNGTVALQLVDTNEEAIPGIMAGNGTIECEKLHLLNQPLPLD